MPVLVDRKARWRARFALDLRSLALFRVGLGAVVLVDLAARASRFDALYGDGGALPRGLAPNAGDTIFILYTISASPAWAYGLTALTALFAVALAVGWKARPSAVATWLLLGSLHARNPYTLDAGDLLLRLLLVWGALLPLGARFSRGPRGARPPGPEGAAVASWAATGLVLQMVAVYACAGLSKVSRVWLVDRMGLALALGEVYWARPLGFALTAYPRVLAFLSPLVVAFELGLALLLLGPVRTPRSRLLGVFALFAFHGGLAACLELGVFPLVCVVGATALLPAAFWEHGRPAGAEASERAEVRVVEAPRSSGALRALHGSLAFALLGYLALVVAEAVSRRALVPPPIARAAQWLGIEQRWAMYETFPPGAGGWFVVAAHVDDGRVVDLERGGAVVTAAPPALPASQPFSFRWAMYLASFWSEPVAPSERADALAQWYCRHGNDRTTVTAGRPIDRVEVWSLGGRGSSGAPRVVASSPCEPGRPGPF